MSWTAGMAGRLTARALGMAAGVALDAAVGDPARWHPVAGFGKAAGALEHRLWAHSRWRGAGFTALCVGSVAAAGMVLDRMSSYRMSSDAAVTAIATWTVLGARSLRGEALVLQHLLDSRDLDAARQRVRHLVGRNSAHLDAAAIARAGVESVAENTSDAAVAPLLWGAVAGVSGLLGYRAINTLDAMVGHRSRRYRQFGWASARLDDVANLAAARATAAVTALVSGHPRTVWRIVRRDARAHPSPNSGWCEAAFAGALGIRLGGRNIYDGRAEDRPELGDGDGATSADLRLAARLSGRVTLAAAGLCAGALAVVARYVGRS